MKELEPLDKHHLDFAQGWLGLGDWLSAGEELDALPSEFCAHPDVLQLRVQVYEAAGQWTAAAEVARALTVLVPGNSFGWVHWAHSLCELKRVRQALGLLVAVADKYPDDHLIRYNLARCACQLGHFKEALQWLDEAVQLTNRSEVERMVQDHPELQPLWDEVPPASSSALAHEP